MVYYFISWTIVIQLLGASDSLHNTLSVLLLPYQLLGISIYFINLTIAILTASLSIYFIYLYVCQLLTITTAQIESLVKLYNNIMFYFFIILFSVN